MALRVRDRPTTKPRSPPMGSDPTVQRAVISASRVEPLQPTPGDVVLAVTTRADRVAQSPSPPSPPIRWAGLNQGSRVRPSTRPGVESLLLVVHRPNGITLSRDHGVGPTKPDRPPARFEARTFVPGSRRVGRSPTSQLPNSYRRRLRGSLVEISDRAPTREEGRTHQTRSRSLIRLDRHQQIQSTHHRLRGARPCTFDSMTKTKDSFAVWFNTRPPTRRSRIRFRLLPAKQVGMPFR
jgi:hypothetical protein